MRLSDYFLPLLRENPSEAQIVSHRLMLRAGMIRQSSAGIYSWLPLGFRVLQKVEQIVREEQDRAGAQEVLMPTMQPAELWRESGRYDDYGKEMLRIKDRHERDMLYGPTNEELITEIFRSSVKSYRDLPKNLYHIQWKFRDEVRPRFGVMRGREFLMKDNYSFDLDKAGAIRSYIKMFVAYLRTFPRMGLTPIPVRADTGPIGGDLSHEFHHPGGHRRERAVLRQRHRAARREQHRSGFAQRARTMCAAVRRDRREARCRRVRGARARGAPPPRARHRGRPGLLFRHQILDSDGRHRRRARRRAGRGRDGVLRHRRVAPRRRHHRGEPRR